MTGTSKKLVIVVRRGMVDSVYCSKDDSLSGAEVIDLDSTDPSEMRRSNLSAKKAKKQMRQIY